MALIVVSLYIGKWTSNEFVGQLARHLLFGFVMFVGLYECYRCVELSGTKVNKPLGYLLMAAVWLGSFVCLGFVGSRLDAIVLMCFLMCAALPAALIWQLWRNDDHPFVTVSATLVGVLYLALPMALLLLGTADRQVVDVVMMTFILTWVCDTGAYLSGMAFGRHKLWPRHSPGKTWEGLCGGLLLCVGAAMLVGPLFGGALLSGWQWPVLAVIVVVFGTLGDLAESMLKRSAGLKDSGNIMPGHGGILDRFDSMLLIVPIMFLYCCLFL